MVEKNSRSELTRLEDAIAGVPDSMEMPNRADDGNAARSPPGGVRITKHVPPDRRTKDRISPKKGFRVVLLGVDFRFRLSWLFAALVIASAAMLFFGASSADDPFLTAASAATTRRSGGGRIDGSESTDPGAARYRGDPLLDLVSRIQDGDYDWREDVSTGRFLESFDVKAYQLDDVDVGDIEVQRRGAGFVVLEAAYQPVAQPEGRAELRFVNRSGDWKIEELKLVLDHRTPFYAATPAWRSTDGSNRSGPPRGSQGYQLFSDVTHAFERGEQSGLVSLETTEEWTLFEDWRAVLWSEGHSGMPTLTYLGNERDGVRKYQVSFGSTRLGTIRLKEIGRRWHIVGVEGRSTRSSRSTFKREVLRAMMSKYGEGEK